MVIGIDASRALVSAKTGTENYSYHLIKHLLRLPESRQHIFVLFIRPNAIIPDWIQQKNVQIKLIKYRILWTQIGLAAETWKKFRTPKSSEHLVSGEHYLDILWIPAHTLPFLRRLGLPTVVTIHGLEYRWLREYHNLLQRWYLPLSTMYAAHSASRLIAVSRFTKRQLIQELHTNPNKIKVIHEGVEINARMHERRNTGMNGILRKYGLQHKKYILFVGTIQPRKNLDKLVEAFSQLHLRLRGDMAQIKLVIAGAVGWDAQAVLRASVEQGIPDKVIFTGRVDQASLETLYRGASIYVQPSITEGFGLPVLEAMVREVVVISSDGGALPEVVARAGVIVPLGRNFVSQLVLAIKGLLKDKKRQKEYKAMGLARASYLSWDRSAKETLKYLVG